MVTRPRKALIIGAGIAGPAAAVFLKRAGFDAALFEAWPYSAGIGGGLQIAPNGMRVLAEIGLADEMIRRGSISESFDFYSHSGSKLGSINRNMQQRFGQPAVNMRRSTLIEVIVNKAWCENVELRFEKRLARIEDRADQPVVAHFSDGSSGEGDFLIGADGVHSMVRQHVMPDGPRPFDTGLVGFGGFVPRSLIEGSQWDSALRLRSDKAASSDTAFAAPTRITARCGGAPSLRTASMPRPIAPWTRRPCGGICSISMPAGTIRFQRSFMPLKTLSSPTRSMSPPCRSGRAGARS